MGTLKNGEEILATICGQPEGGVDNFVPDLQSTLSPGKKAKMIEWVTREVELSLVCVTIFGGW